MNAIRGLFNLFLITIWLGAQFGIVHGGHIVLMSIFWLCALIVFGSFVVEEKTILTQIARFGSFLGAVMNAYVVISNGGWMPVINMHIITSGGIWRPAMASDHLLFFADRFFYFSVGDFFIIGFFVLAALIRSLEKRNLEKKHVIINT